MARSIWTGFLTFGLVSVPVGLFPATEDKGFHFNQLQAGTSDRIRYRKVNERTGEEVGSDQIVRGYDLGGGEYVIVTSDELRDVAPGRSETIEIRDFVDLSEIDPIYFQRTYYLGPRGKGADHAYALLRQAMEETERVGIATFVMRDKEYLVAVRPTADVLALETMYWADEVRDAREELGQLPVDERFSERELDTAKRLVESLTVPFKPESYEDTYRARVDQLIEEKRAGRSVVTEAERPKANVVNLMEALQASLERARNRGTDGGGAGEGASGGAGDGRREGQGPGEGAARSAGPVSRDGSEAAERDDGEEGEDASSRAAEPGLAAMSKSDLLSRAAELDIEGRSKMTKEQLIDAVKAATSPKRRGRKAS
jgi:DNA end-binding protein Ku